MIGGKTIKREKIRLIFPMIVKTIQQATYSNIINQHLVQTNRPKTALHDVSYGTGSKNCENK